MDKVTINIVIEDGVITITDNMGNESTNSFDPEVTISDQLGTYVAEHIENNNIYSEIIAEGIENSDYIEDEDDDSDDWDD